MQYRQMTINSVRIITCHLMIVTPCLFNVLVAAGVGVYEIIPKFIEGYPLDTVFKYTVSLTYIKKRGALIDIKPLFASDIRTNTIFGCLND
jgi:hypothetical protein